MRGLDPRIHVLNFNESWMSKTWMAGTGPAMTTVGQLTITSVEKPGSFSGLKVDGLRGSGP